VICSVCGRYPVFANETACVSGGTASEHGVWQVWPCAVRTWAPGGWDSNCIVCNGGGDGLLTLSQSGIEGMDSDEPEQAASETAIAAVAARAMSCTRNIDPIRLGSTLGRTAVLVKYAKQLLCRRDDDFRFSVRLGLSSKIVYYQKLIRGVCVGVGRSAGPEH